MRSRMNIAMISLATIWIVTGVVFGSLSFVGVASTGQAAHALGQVHSETITVPAPASTHG